jgi:glucose dehydrogenase
MRSEPRKSQGPHSPALPASSSDPAARAVDDGHRAVDDGRWTIAAKDYASTRYSGLDQITTSNVPDLRLAWTFSTGVLRGHEAAPIVAGTTMYLVTPHPNILYALDLAAGGELRWKYEPKPSRAARGVACCDVVNRGAAYDDQAWKIVAFISSLAGSAGPEGATADASSGDQKNGGRGSLEGGEGGGDR